jgi:hypothetical protein
MITQVLQGNRYHYVAHGVDCIIEVIKLSTCCYSDFTCRVLQDRNSSKGEIKDFHLYENRITLLKNQDAPNKEPIVIGGILR